ncbi:hypothetical protein G6016_06845 [Dietzia aerolata]|uniref:Uncharacterized protein n=1 Tax=Dietzia aerolata TaxID=595984 RepID=A0ABV5JUH0_9ACTN|nr:hypothetical protein [Dietzia aerolata]MBB0968680.1 hypothetical protein [Dietzia aerolata]
MPVAPHTSTEEHPIYANTDACTFVFFFEGTVHNPEHPESSSSTRPQA